ncbi:hypothetical protein LSH36_226g01042 [Paralvinella palmiformis]|uniref:UDP-glucose 4-epimerase n=1 Tax=Paralvinella palmiformis TaxID=53620 RepID=A0AAD9N421_9ANNE|nr:hypothetical protein LSH36_226g01042 [Paralvinella palmiformis]
MDEVKGIMNKSGKKPCALLTGGAGYIGNHTAIEMIKADYDVVIVDNLHNSYMEALKRVEKILDQKLTIYVEDLLDKAALQKVFSKHHFDCVIHFAGLKAVYESVEKPLLYYRNNLNGTINLLENRFG